MRRRLPAALFASALALAACVAVDAPAARAQDDLLADPLDPLKAATAEQDRLLDLGKGEEAVAAARERAKDGTPESFYLLGRALGNVAVQRAETQLKERLRAGPPRDPNAPPPGLEFDADLRKMMDEADAEFERSREAGGLLFAPAHLGIARVARCLGRLDRAVDELQKALRISKNFKAAALELAQVYREKGTPGEAETALYRFLEVRPSDPDARIVLGVLKLERRRFAEAEPEFRAVLSKDAGNLSARKLLANDLMYQEKYEESAEHWEVYRLAEPKDDEGYVKLFHVYRQLRKKEQAVGVLNDLIRALPGTEAARRAAAVLKQLEADPAAWDRTETEDPRSALVQRLKSPDPKIVQKALEDMRVYRWPVLPATVYQLLRKDQGTQQQRLAAVRLIGDLADPHTLPILEILLAHPVERERESDVRKEVAHAISMLPSDAITLVLVEALTDPDSDVREWAVQGIASRTGKWFRTDLAVKTDDNDWPAELSRYQKWWASTSASSAKRNATTALFDIYEPVARESKVRIARYALPAMDDAIEGTWRVGYDLFRAVTFHSLGADQGPVDATERIRIAAEAREWLERETKGK